LSSKNGKRGLVLLPKDKIFGLIGESRPYFSKEKKSENEIKSNFFADYCRAFRFVRERAE
jgi:hypothetical protein